MGFFASTMLAACGIGLYAVAALVWDRRRELADRAGAVDPRRRSMPTLVILGSLLVGTVMVIGGVAWWVKTGADVLG